ncbi:MAG: hypothetical protein EXR72_07895 [Myxococcales bacterium]|nr:hypothetical protein [Myxococcales bacterium]
MSTSPRRTDLTLLTDPAAGLAALPRRKPMAKATRVTLFEREVRERLSDPAIEILLGAAAVLSEGQVARAAGGGEAYFGTTMLTVDLAATTAFREACDVRAARRVAELMAGDARITRLARQVAEREASRLAGRHLRVSASDVRVRAEGTTLFIDVDLESALLR